MQSLDTPFKVVDFGTNQKRVYDFLLVRNSNLGHILHHFGDIAVFCAPGQGCVLAPALFCRAMDFIMDHVSPKVGIQVGQHSYTAVSYTHLTLPTKRIV